MFAALGEPTRLKVVARLCAEGPLSTVHLGAGTAMTRQALTKHLRALEDAGLVRGTRGRPRMWQVRPRRLDDARAWLEHASRQWDVVLARLKAFVED